MATITGFTAERMLVIEKETVVDGEVRGDNLFLMTREGVEIDAGNVRGPQGDQGTPGAPSAVGTVNEQIGSVFTPRTFANKAALDLWTTAPNGTQGVTLDNEIVWEKSQAAWIATTPMRAFSNATDLNNKWTTPPRGAMAVTTDNDTEYYRDTAGWEPNNGVRVFNSLAELNARWSNAPRGAMAVTIDTHATYLRTINGWQPPINSIVHNSAGWFPDVNHVGAGVRNVHTSQNPIFPYPTQTIANVSFSGGYGTDWTGWYTQIVNLQTAGQMAQAWSASSAAYWTGVNMTYAWTQGPNQNTGFHVYFTPYAFGGGGNNIHSMGNSTLQILSII
jgi:hypothetical protein